MNNDHGNDVMHKLTHHNGDVMIEIRSYEICGFNSNPGTDELPTVDEDARLQCVADVLDTMRRLISQYVHTYRHAFLWIFGFSF
jgi:hypothetical protein